MKKIILFGMLVLSAFFFEASPDGLVFTKEATASECGSATNSRACDTFFYRVRFWDWRTFSSSLQEEILHVQRGESHGTYAFTPGAVSRDLNDKMVKEWQQGKAKTIKVCVNGLARVPGVGDNISFEACLGKNKANPDETYIEWRVPRTATLSHPNPDFAVTIARPEGCTIVYWADKKNGGETGTLSTRSNVDGENELHKIAGQTAKVGVNLNFILDCRGT